MENEIETVVETAEVMEKIESEVVETQETTEEAL